MIGRRDRAGWVVTFLMLLGQGVWAQEPEAVNNDTGVAEALFAAAREADVDGLRQALEAGASVEATTRYGATALHYAADRGSVPAAALLLEAGADPNVRDSFYNATPMTWALSRRHFEVVTLLLDRGSEDIEGVLQFGAQTGDLDLVKLATAAERNASAQQLSNALDVASLAGHDDIVEHLTPLVGEAPEDEEAVVLSRAEQDLLAGRYENEQLGMKIRVFVEGDALKMQPEGQPALTLRPSSKTDLSTVEIAGIDLSFSGRGGTIERFQLSQAGQQFLFGRVLPATDPEPAGAAASADRETVERVAPSDEVSPHWPSFRGSSASGVGRDAPTEWNGEEGLNVLWRAPLPGIALSSPVIWGDRLYITTATSEGADPTFRTGFYGDVDFVDDSSEHRWILYALDAGSGDILWERTSATGVPRVKRHLKSSHANPTPATDGEYVVAMMGSEGLFCYRTNGDLVWSHDLGTLNSGWFYDASYEWGFASSPILYGGNVIVQVDIQGESYLAAYDLETGEQEWRTARKEIPTWGTPTILPSEGGDEIVTNGTTVRGYDAATGKEKWWVTPNGEVTVATPVIAEGMAIVTSNYPPARPIYAIRPGGRGDLSLPTGESSSEFIAWSHNPGGAYIPTPIVYGGLLYVLRMTGRLSVYDVKTGEEVYRERVGRGDTFAASPVAAGGKLYFTTEEGRTYVVRAGREYELLATNELGEVVMASPAVASGRLYLRGLDHLYALGESSP